jgi:LysM domain
MRSTFVPTNLRITTMTLALSTTSPARHVRPSRATFRRRRAAVAVVTVVLVGVGVQVGSGVLSGPGGVPASATGAATAPAARHVRAEPGDSLWSIAERFHGDIALTDYVEALIQLNGGTAIAAGQRVRLP